MGAPLTWSARVRRPPARGRHDVTVPVARRRPGRRQRVVRGGGGLRHGGQELGAVQLLNAPPPPLPQRPPRPLPPARALRRRLGPVGARVEILVRVARTLLRAAPAAALPAVLARRPLRLRSAYGERARGELRGVPFHRLRRRAGGAISRAACDFTGAACDFAGACRPSGRVTDPRTGCETRRRGGTLTRGIVYVGLADPRHRVRRIRQAKVEQRP
eukprot:268782-Prorocentrum_minimum.AAC.2